MAKRSRYIKNIFCGLGALIVVGGIVYTVILADNSHIQSQCVDVLEKGFASDDMTRNKCLPEVNPLYYVAMGVESLLFVLILTYLVMSNYNKNSLKETFDNRDKVAIFCLLSILLAIVLTLGEIIIASKIGENGSENYLSEVDEFNNTNKDTDTEDNERSQEVVIKSINLNGYDSDITIAEAGEYTVSGEFEHSLLVNAPGKVKLILDNATIRSSITAAIANISTEDLEIELAAGSHNYLSDGNSNEYDTCIYSVGRLYIYGSGVLEIDGEVISTDDNNSFIVEDVATSVK